MKTGYFKALELKTDIKKIYFSLIVISDYRQYTAQHTSEAALVKGLYKWLHRLNL